MELPLFPLHAVLCPGIALPLHIFEPRYRTMVARCLDSGGSFGVVLIRDGHEVGDATTSVATIGTIADIREASRSSDGRYQLLVVGGRRFRVVSVTVGREPYLVGEVEPLDEPMGDPTIARGLTGRVTEAFLRYLALAQPGDGEDAEEIDVRVEVEVDDPDDASPAGGRESATSLPAPDERRSDADRDALDDVARRVTGLDDPTTLSYLVSGILQVDQPVRQNLLEAATTEDRLRDLLRLIDREVVLLERRLRSFRVDPRLTVLRRN
jgi:Lon protease-like protein